jgi:phospholipid/cholesterol/gamma-HCH transport system permease protein
MTPPSLKVQRASNGQTLIQLSGNWTLRAGGHSLAALHKALSPYFSRSGVEWDLSDVEHLDSAGASLLWLGWGKTIPSGCRVRKEHADLLNVIAEMPAQTQPFTPLTFPGTNLWQLWLRFTAHIIDFVALAGDLLLEAVRLLRHPPDIPWKEISANIYKGGVMALPVTALVGCMIGVAMSYLMALQLRKFGADIFIINILGLAIIRELGPILMSVLVAGRSGSAMTAQIGVMRVTE